MTNTKMLEDAIKKSGLHKGYICERLNISYQGLTNKVSGTTEFKASEISTLTNLLKLTMRQQRQIFFSDYVDK